VRGSWDKIDACVDGVHDHKVDHADEPKVWASYASSQLDA
jgi:hypothetical protein